LNAISKINSSSLQKTKVLVAPLDWGLGHATRCIPIIRQLLIAGCEVIIASERAQKKLLQDEFPKLRFVELRGYRLKYGSKGWQTLPKIIFQIPKILIQINRENRWLKSFLQTENIDAVIADNRFGLYSSKLFCVFITHQLSIKTPFGNSVEKKLQRINYRFINKFDNCWVPDFEKENALAGKLSHPVQLPRTPVHYIGLLSRFEKIKTSFIKNNLLIILSGPEPQRTIFENLLLPQIKKFPGKIILVRGLPAEKNTLNVPGIEIYNHLPASDLNKIICESDFVIGRSGYSTVMDLAKLGSKSILVPTPGQTEQEYLAEYLLENKIAFSTRQENFSLPGAIENAKYFSFVQKEFINKGLLESAIEELIKKIS
jgi:UDP-N-acetylglucosamine transferase subunit ALG13